MKAFLTIFQMNLQVIGILLSYCHRVLCSGPYREGMVYYVHWPWSGDIETTGGIEEER